MTDWSPAVLAFANAVKIAEGSNPDWNNPGDLTGADAGSFVTLGIANSEGVLKFARAEDGWNALCMKLARMLTGMSHVYPLSMTLEQVGMKYSNGDPNWAKNVCAELKIPEATTLAELARMDFSQETAT